ncbi:MAG TPA: S26 family signal peptidase [Micromonosporaceae bacterium]|nr:S26 family signal peptidase [Micromonosporaceae bacterium]
MRRRGESGRRRPSGPGLLYVVLVQGPSMAPTLRHGDALLVRRGGRRVRAGDVVVARFAARPDLVVVKRAVRAEGDGWWVRGDNDLATDDSRTYGVAEVLGRVVLRYWPRPGRIANRTG